MNLSPVQFKAVLVDAVLGREVPAEYREAWDRAGLCTYDLLHFKREALEELTTDELYQLYCETRARY